MAVSQSLSVTEVSGSVNVSANTSQVRIQWRSSQTGDSWNGYEKTAKYYVSINGGAETTYSVNYTLPKNTTQTIVDTTITINHKTDGSGSISVRTWMDTGISAGVVEKSKSLTLTTIPRASTISLADAVTLGNSCKITFTPASKSFWYKIKFSLGLWGTTTEAFNPNTTSPYTYTGYTIPLNNVANRFPNNPSGTMTATLYTYSDSTATTQVGSVSTKTFAITLPNNSSTQPTVSMTLAPVHSLGSTFNSVYIQGKSKVQATLSATGKYDATINTSSYKMVALGKSDTSSPYQTDYLDKSGTVTVTGYATDSRGFTGSTAQNITVIPYSKPKIIPASGENSVICARCDKDGNLSESGTYLKIKAKRSYSSVESLNRCAIRYRCKPATNASFTDSDWVTILAKNSTSDEVETAPIANVVSNTLTSYIVEIGVIDDVGESASVKMTIPTLATDFHLREGGGGAAFGKYAEKEKCLDIADGWVLKVRGDLEVGGVSAYVVEQGTQGIWSYRKWSNGFAECWGTITANGTFTNAWGTLYACGPTPATDYPFEFATRPTEIATGRTPSLDCWLFSKLSGGNTAQKTGQYAAARPTINESEVTISIDLIVRGRWK